MSRDLYSLSEKPIERDNLSSPNSFLGSLETNHFRHIDVLQQGLLTSKDLQASGINAAGVPTGFGTFCSRIHPYLPYSLEKEGKS